MMTVTAAIECKRCGKSSNDRFEDIEDIEAMQDADGLCSVCYMDLNDEDNY